MLNGVTIDELVKRADKQGGFFSPDMDIDEKRAYMLVLLKFLDGDPRVSYYTTEDIEP